MRKSLKNRILMVIIIFTFVINILSIYINYKQFKISSMNLNYNTATAIKEACNIIINKKHLKSYKKSRERNGSYYKEWRSLLQYQRSNPDVSDISVVWFEGDGCHYIFNASNEKKNAVLGDIERYSPELLKLKEKLIKNEIIEPISGENNIIFCFNIENSEPIGYITIKINTKSMEEKQVKYFVQLTLLLSLIAIIAIFVLMKWLKIYVISPINSMSYAAQSYDEQRSDNSSVLDGLNITTGDEIEYLYISMKKMEKDLVESANNLSKATWNSYHDSMTKLYNKRMLKEIMENHVVGQKVAVFYFDIDNLKKMNDTCGHEQGDFVICGAADFIKKHTPANGGTAIRIGGDEFIMFIYDKAKSEIEEIYNNMQSDPDKELTDKSSPVQCRVAVGYEYSNTTRDLKEIMEVADQNMYKDKKSHR